MPSAARLKGSRANPRVRITAMPPDDPDQSDANRHRLLATPRVRLQDFDGIFLVSFPRTRIDTAGIKEMFQEFRGVKSDIKIAWHSCGSIIPIVPDFIEIGLDILNPIQPLAAQMEPKFLKDTFGQELIFFGGIDIQDLMPNGTPEQIKVEVDRRIDILGKDGGYIIAPAHNIQVDTSVENILSFFNSVKNYPIK